MVDPGATALITDFDGTLSPIVADPGAARPLEGVVDLLHRLCRRFAVVAVVSGRPAAFLAERLSPTGGSPPPPDGAAHPLRLIGLYGLEEVDADGTVRLTPEALPWVTVVAGVARRLADEAPTGVRVEVKGAAVTVHWRQAPESEGWVVRLVAGEAARTGLVPYPGRASIELRPPLTIDKGTVVRGLTDGCRAACFLGDDLGDLPAYAALARRSVEDGTPVVGVAVRDAETSPDVLAVADLVVDGPAGARDVLAWLESAAGPGDPDGTGAPQV